MLLAMVSLITIKVLILSLPGCDAAAYWTYLTDPPIFHLTIWDFASVKVTTNALEFLGGERNNSAVSGM